MAAVPPFNGVIETCLYVKDLPRAEAFYQSLFGCEKMIGDDRFCAFNLQDRHVLLLFVEGGSTKPVHIPSGVIPPHDGSGTTHIGFSIPRDSVTAWRERLAELGIAIESTVNWPRGGVSLYFRDPDQHLVELLTPGVWSMH